MRREDVQTLLSKIPPLDHTKVVLVLLSGASINMDFLFRMEKEYVVVRGREAGTNDEGRGFFVPYEQIAFLKIERLMRLNELREMYGEALLAEVNLTEDGVVEGTTKPLPVAPASSVKSAAVDPAAIAKQNLLERIRAARTSAGVPKPLNK